jgi:hypothetical protein
MLDVSDSACVNCAQRRRQTRSARQTQTDGRARQSRTVQRGRRTSSFRRTRAAGRRRDERARQGDGRARSGVADCASQPWRGGGGPWGGTPPQAWSHRVVRNYSEAPARWSAPDPVRCSAQLRLPQGRRPRTALTDRRWTGAAGPTDARGVADGRAHSGAADA